MNKSMTMTTACPIAKLQQSPRQPREGILIRISKELKSHTLPQLLKKYKQKKIECTSNATLMLLLFGYVIWYTTDMECDFRAYSLYHVLLIFLLCIDLYYESRLLRVLCDLSRSLTQIANKQESLEELRIRLLIYRFNEQTTREALMPPNEIQCRKITFYFALLAFIGQLSFLSRHSEFACHFEGEALVVNAAVWASYLLIAFAFRMVNSVGQSFLFQCAIEGKHFHNESIESLEMQWKIRSSQDILIPQSSPSLNGSNRQIQVPSQQQMQQNLNSNSSVVMQQPPILEQHQEGAAEIQVLPVPPSTKIHSQNNVIAVHQSNPKLNEVVAAQDERVGEQKIVLSPRKEMKDEQECQICLMGFEGGSVARQMKCCKKIFHYDCCLNWFLDKPSCPNCRALPSSLVEDTLDASQVMSERPNFEHNFIQEYLGRQMFQKIQLRNNQQLELQQFQQQSDQQQQQEHINSEQQQQQFPQVISTLKLPQELFQESGIAAAAVAAASSKSQSEGQGVRNPAEKIGESLQPKKGNQESEDHRLNRTIDVKDREISFIDQTPPEELKKEYQHQESKSKNPSRTKISNRVHIEPMGLKQ